MLITHILSQVNPSFVNVVVKFDFSELDTLLHTTGPNILKHLLLYEVLVLLMKYLSF